MRASPLQQDMDVASPGTPLTPHFLSTVPAAGSALHPLPAGGAGAGLAMGPRDSPLLVLVLCLGQTVHAQEGLWPKPSIRAEPGPVIRRGQPVTLVCRGPAGAALFRLVDENGRNVLPDQTNVSQPGPPWAEATFHIKAVSEDTAGSYRCLYLKGPRWSERSDVLELKVAVPGTAPEVTPPPTEVTPPPTGPVSQTESDYFFLFQKCCK